MQTEIFTPVNESNHDELLSLLKPLVEFMDKHEYNYLFLAGKDKLCSRYIRGRRDDIAGMLHGFVENNPELKGFFEL
jgi:hypothetical protein